MRIMSSRSAATAISFAVTSIPFAAAAQVSLTAPSTARLSLPGQPLADALDQIGARFGLKIDVDRRAIRGWRSHAVVDAVNADDAVTQALTGTGLDANRSADGATIGIGKPDPGRLAADIVVTAPRNQAETSYKADGSDTANRSGAPNHDLPFASSIVTAQLLSDQQALSVDDAVRNVASVKNNIGSVQGGNFYQVRGFVADTTTNGLSTPGNIYQGIDSVERVEVLKGPAAILQGQGSLGGTVNVVTKKPTTTKLLDLEVQGGSFGEFKVALDGSTRLSDNGPLSGRVIMSGLHTGRTFGGYDGSRQYLLAPAVRYKDDRLDATIGVDYSDTRNPFVTYTQFAADTGKLVDRDNGNAIGFRNAYFKFTSTNVHADIQYAIAPWLTFVGRASHVDLEAAQRYFLVQGNVTVTHPSAFTGDAPYFVTGAAAGLNSNFGTWSADGYLRAKFETGPIRHTMSGGYNLRISDGVTNFLSGPQTFSFDIRDDAAVPRSAQLVGDGTDGTRDYTRSQGYYLQDLAEYGPLHLFGAIRRNLYFDRFRAGSRQTLTKDSAWTPSAGLVIDLVKQISVYGNYSKGFFPTEIRDYDGNRLPPIQSKQFEAGIKADLDHSRASFTLSAFQITQKNQAQVDPRSFTAPTPTCSFSNFCYVLAGGLRSRGIEAELKGEILPGWNITLSGTRSWYSYFQQEVPLTGDPYASLVKARGSLFTVYTIGRGALRGFGIGGGLTAQSGSSAGNLVDFDPATFAPTVRKVRVPGYARTDLSLYYRSKRLDVVAGVQNVFDRTDYTEASIPAYIPLLAPRIFRLTLTVHGVNGS